METFNNYIDEFVDWVTGEDTSSQEEEEKIRVSSTGGLPVSGGSIRELLQARLKKPFTYYEDEVAGLFRLFSSDSTKQKWIRMNTPGSSDYNPEESTKLELFNFVRPADVVMTYNGLDPNPKYVINGDSTSTATQLEFSVYLSKEEGGGIIYEYDAFTVTYKIVDSNGVEHTSVEEKDTTFLNSTSKKVTKDIYQYLTVGKNDVTITMKAKNSSAGNASNFSIYLIDFKLESRFDYSTHWSPNEQIQIPVSVRRSDTNLTLEVYGYIDKTSTSPGQEVIRWEETNQESNPTRTFYIPNVYTANSTSSDHIKHTLTLMARMHDASTGRYHYSNVLCYDFVVASSSVGIVNQFVNTAYDVPYSKMHFDQDMDRITIVGTQYEPISLDWAYYTDRDTTGQTANIQWALRVISQENGESVTTYTPIGYVEGQNHSQGQTFNFIPDFTTEGLSNVALVALNENGNEIDAFPISVSRSNLSISETKGYNLKLSAYGKTNQSPDKDVWADISNNVISTFTNIIFDDNSGWSNNSFVTSGSSQYLTINYCPLPDAYDLAGDGKTIEIDFMPEKVSNDGDVVITIGDPTKGHIDITTNEAAVYNGSSKIIHTNYKANERIKLAFVFNPVQAGSPSSDLVYIINNGILERAESYGTAASYLSDLGYIKIGGSDSGIRVYNIRCYNKALTYDEELNNYIYDSDQKANIINRNDIFTSSVIDYTKVKNKIDTVVITGNLNALLTQGSQKDESETTVNFKRECITDASKSFEVTNGMIRKHGQSTLNYPITSMKIWTNKAKENNVSTTISLSEAQRAEGLNKNRYIMKTGAIPSNKFVLQANYADSAGVHNGALLRLIQDTWYNANFGTNENPIYRLRTAPQLFASGYTLIHNNANLGEDGSWIEGTGVGQAAGKTWKDISTKQFPYVIRNAPDSFPCAVFYKNGVDDGYHFLGQYVFMDDKKSDYIYGERSIYHYGTDNDPFVLRTENTKNGPNGKQDISENCVWDNKDVLRIEVVLPNTRLTSYMDFNVKDNNNNTHLCTDIKYDERGRAERYFWEDYFEIVYPDDDDIAKDDAKDGLTKFDANSKFVKKVKPFIDFLKWITDCKQNYNTATDWWSAGTYSSTQEAFEATAHDHLDLYKVAAYYIFFLRFGLVDSVERNAQLKTYDGVHWHYEPWDMDIALGNTNQGALVLNPPMDRTTLEPGTTTYAYSGKSTTTSNTLWDCLENWTYWSETVVQDVAKALYNAGLNYDNIINMFDKEYAEAWSESMYNQSGYFKYIESGGSDWLAWLQGSRTSHRHWWISTSMNYYDAKWSCGSFNEHRIRIFADKAINAEGTDIITIKPTSNTFFKIAQQEGSASLGFKSATRQTPATFDISTVPFSAKDPSYIYGGTFVEEIDLSCFAEKFKAADLSLCYDSVLGAPIKKLNVGIPYTVVDSTTYTGKVSGTKFRLTGYDSTTKQDAFANLQDLDITGQGTITSTQDLLSTRNRKNLVNFHAIGSGITSFISSTSGNKFGTIQIPGITTTTYSNADSTVVGFNTLTMQNSSWDTIEFWNTTKTGDITYVTDEHGELVLDDEDLPILVPNAATFTKSAIPATLNTVQFKGSTARNECAGQFLLDWIDAIDASLPAGHTEQDLYDALSNKTFEAENINWGVDGQSISISYNTLARIAHFNRGNNSGGKLKGYILLSDTTPLTTEQLGQITAWFGPSAFSKSSKNSRLVIDQAVDYARITTTGTYISNNDICLNEGNSATLMVTRFMLSETDQSDYVWWINDGANNNNISSIQEVKSARLVRGEDGAVHLIATASGIYDDYYVTIGVNKSGMQTPEYITIKIISVILPEYMEVHTQRVAVADARPFYIKQGLQDYIPALTNKITNLEDNSIRDSYVLFDVGQQVEFYPVLVDGETPSNASITAIQYQVTSILPQYTSYTSLTGYPNTIENQQGDDYLYYTKSATNRGIVIGVSSVPSNMILYEIKIRVVVAQTSFIKTVNIILLDDKYVVHNSYTSAAVQTCLNELHTSLYGTTITDYYKSNLLSLFGTLDLSSNANGVDNLLDSSGNTSLLYYLPNITGLNLSGCSRFTGVLDVTYNPNLTYLNTQGTSLGVKFPQYTKITTVDLGSPISVELNNPYNPINITIQSQQNLTSLVLEYINSAGYGDASNGNVNTYNTFNTLYSTT